MPLASETRVGPYEIISTLGSGSMGEVYVAHDPRLRRNVALKIINPGSSSDSTRQKRFAVEARAASALSHPNIITVHDFGSADGISYIVSELVDGESLRAIVHRGPLQMRNLLEVAIQIADGLAAAHEAGIIHRDLKPENIMLTRSGRVKILDFGLAKPTLSNSGGDNTSDSLAVDMSMTQPGLIVGSVGYMSPEQARGEEVGVQSDQFSLGLILHELASGHPAFRRDTPMATLLAIANVDRIPFTPGPVAFRLLVEKLLSKDPSRRFASTGEIRQRLERILQGLPSKAPTEAIQEDESSVAITPAPSRRPIAIALVAMLAALCLGFLLGSRRPLIQRPDLAQLRMEAVTNSGTAGYPAIAPDGQTLAWVQTVDGTKQIFLKQNQANPFAVTHEAGDCRAPFFSPDGSAVLYLLNGELRSESIFGGTPQNVASGVLGAAYSPDGKTLALARPDGVYLNGKRLAGLVAWNAPVELQFSPDGDDLGVLSAGELKLQPLRRGPVKTIASGVTGGFAFLHDGHRILFGRDHLWIADLSTGQNFQLTAGSGFENWPAVSKDGEFVLFSTAQFQQPVEQTFAPGRQFRAYSKDGWIWMQPAKGVGEPSKLTKGEWPSWSPDGRWIAFVADGGVWKIAPLQGQSPIFVRKSNSAGPLAWSEDSNGIRETQQPEKHPEPVHSDVWSLRGL